MMPLSKGFSSLGPETARCPNVVRFSLQSAFTRDLLIIRRHRFDMRCISLESSKNSSCLSHFPLLTHDQDEITTSTVGNLTIVIDRSIDSLAPTWYLNTVTTLDLGL